MIQTSAYVRKVVLVDEQDQVIGEATLLKAHEGKGLLHRAASVFLFRKNTGKLELLLQQRSAGKIVAPKLWANSACGNVAPGQSYEQCAASRLKIELGISQIKLTKLFAYRYQVLGDENFSENEITMIFAGWLDEKVTPNPAEVSQTQWLAWEKILLAGKTGSLKYNGQIIQLAPWLQLIINEQKIIRKFENFLKETP